jgi:hypothetical protein
LHDKSGLKYLPSENKNKQNIELSKLINPYKNIEKDPAF